MIIKAWHRSKVLSGEQLGRTIGFPTLNLSPKTFDKEIKTGVYACLVKYKNRTYQAVLFYGPRLVKGETNRVLEIYIFNFDKDIYGQTIEFKIISYMREVKNFSNLGQLAQGIGKDMAQAKKIFLNQNAT